MTFNFDLTVMAQDVGMYDEQSEAGAADIFVFATHAIEDVEDFLLVVKLDTAAVVGKDKIAVILVAAQRDHDFRRLVGIEDRVFQQVA